MLRTRPPGQCRVDGSVRQARSEGAESCSVTQWHRHGVPDPFGERLRFGDRLTRDLPPVRVGKALDTGSLTGGEDPKLGWVHVSSPARCAETCGECWGRSVGMKHLLPSRCGIQLRRSGETSAQQRTGVGPDETDAPKRLEGGASPKAKAPRTRSQIPGAPQGATRNS